MCLSPHEHTHEAFALNNTYLLLDACVNTAVIVNCNDGVPYLLTGIYQMSVCYTCQ